MKILLRLNVSKVLRPFRLKAMKGLSLVYSKVVSELGLQLSKKCGMDTPIS